MRSSDDGRLSGHHRSGHVVAYDLSPRAAAYRKVSQPDTASRASNRRSFAGRVHIDQRDVRESSLTLKHAATDFGSVLVSYCVHAEDGETISA